VCSKRNRTDGEQGTMVDNRLIDSLAADECSVRRTEVTNKQAVSSFDQFAVLTAHKGVRQRNGRIA
jgi:hypothetical protein